MDSNLMRLGVSLFAGGVLFVASCASSPNPKSEWAQNQMRTPMPTPAEGPRTPGRFPVDSPVINAGSYIMIDGMSGRPLAHKFPDQIRPVASTQKLVTALVVLSNGPLDQTMRVKPADTRAPPSKAYLKSGDSYTRRDLLNVCLVKSANDAAESLAREVGGSLNGFARLMNLKAQELGCYDSHFVNPHGLTASGQYSSARDMAKVAFHAYRHPAIRSIVRQKKYTLHTPRGPKYFDSTNKLLKRMHNCNGMKTGYTRAAGKCLISSATFNGRSVILVQLDSTKAKIFDDARRMMTWGLNRSGNTSQFALR